MKIAVIEDGGQQVIVKEGQSIELAYNNGLKDNEKFTPANVLLVKDGDKVSIGTPYVKDSKVELQLVRHTRDEKIRVFKYHSKTAYRRTRGHKQRHSLFKVLKITA